MDENLIRKAINMIRSGYSKLDVFYLLGMTTREMDEVDYILSFD